MPSTTFPITAIIVQPLVNTSHWTFHNSLAFYASLPLQLSIFARHLSTISDGPILEFLQPKVGVKRRALWDDTRTDCCALLACGVLGSSLGFAHEELLETLRQSACLALGCSCYLTSGREFTGALDGNDAHTLPLSNDFPRLEHELPPPSLPTSTCIIFPTCHPSSQYQDSYSHFPFTDPYLMDWEIVG
ncbi:hypothetical protein BDP27DRAFT_1426401 [Rhodocollybia butyracea]|uniref:Uncharacterized protein n=1 Tax=Rhodocollybia butyracea TaxID=206335 RepID=A0A9P5U2V4_9AGAR|nr:hypothetical protein BDP27DRAFT_1426401 [Rhodocollybia butyracea]